MRYRIQNHQKLYEFTTDLKFSIGAYSQRYDGIPRMKLVINFTEKAIDENGNEVYLQTDYFPFPYYGTFTIEVTNDGVWIYIDNESDFRLIKEAIEKIGIEVSPMWRENS